MKTLAQLNSYSTGTVTFTDETAGIGQILANRYQINGLIDTKNTVLSNIDRLCSAAGSWLSYDTHEGKWGVVINQTGTSIASFNDSNIIGSIGINGTGLYDLYNSTNVQFPHRDLRDNPDFVTIEIPSGDRNSNEFDNSLDLSYDVLNEPVQAQLLGFMELKQSRIDLVINFRTDYSYINLKAGDLVTVTNSRFNFNNKVFRIITITEVQEDDGALLMEISALEYNASIYSTTDLYRYTRTDETGIITIGSIGIPGTPQVTKFEIDARPGILVESLAPTGVVEVMEFWISNDVQLTEDNRTYRILGEVKPINGGIFASSDPVRLEYDNLSASDFVIKTRGKNSATTGPYSAVSGFTNFNPTQVTQAIGPNTQSVDALGNIVTALAVVDLLKGVDGIYQKVFSTGSFFESWNETFKDLTGIDLAGQAKEGTLVVSGNAQIAIQDEGIELTTVTSTLNFIGDSVRVENNGPLIDVIINSQVAGGNAPRTKVISSIYPNTGPTGGGTTATIFGNFLQDIVSVKMGGYTATIITVTQDYITVKTPQVPTDTGAVSLFLTFPNERTYDSIDQIFTYYDQYLSIDSFLPTDNSIGAYTIGSYFIKFNTQNIYTGSGFVPIKLYGPFQSGEGTISLYRSNGTLVQTLNVSELIINNDYIEIPFFPREPGTDYYIIADRGFVTYCNKYRADLSKTLTPFTTPWNFKTESIATTSTYSVTSTATYSTTATMGVTYMAATPSFGTQTTNTNITLSIRAADLSTKGFNATGSGNIRINEYPSNNVVATIPASSGTFTGIVGRPTETGNPGGQGGYVLGRAGSGLLTFGKLGDYGITNDGKQYYITADAGIFSYKIEQDCFTFQLSGSSAQLPYSSNNLFTMETVTPDVSTPFAYQSFTVTPDTTSTNVNSSITLNFNFPPLLGVEGSTISIYNASGTLIQEIKGDTNYTRDKTLNLLVISGNSLIINPTYNFDPSTTYYVLTSEDFVMDSRAVTGTVPAITDINIIRFTTSPIIT